MADVAKELETSTRNRLHVEDRVNRQRKVLLPALVKKQQQQHKFNIIELVLYTQFSNLY